MKKARQIVGSLIVFFDRLFAPKPMQRPPEKQEQINNDVRAKLLLYQFETCPFCIKLRRALRRLNLPVPLRDALEPKYEKELIAGGGQRQVPCLRIQTGSGRYRWLYESSDIIKFLEESYP